MAEALRLYGLKAVVMAGASGISEAIARTLVKHGALVLALDTAESGVESVYRAVRGATGAALDASSDDIGGAVVAAAREELGGIDIVFNYLELPQKSPINDSDTDALEKILHARSAIYESVAAATMPYLMKSPAGRLISVGFVRSVFGIDGEQGYEKSRQVLSDFSRKLAAEYGEYGISANYIQPGAVMTPESRKVFSESTDLRDFCIGRSAARRIGESVDIAKVALFLATDDAVFVSGTGVIVDGGRADPAGVSAG
jgi:NAD(P)-dependent dehydrogenase (short-subunit alcohol dehydrogenase family)